MLVLRLTVSLIPTREPIRVNVNPRSQRVCIAPGVLIFSLFVDSWGMLSRPSVHSPGGGGGEDQRLARNAAKSFFSCSVKPMLKRWS